jgi:hypothetical protein
MSTPIHQQSDHWAITLEQIQEGPNVYPAGRISYLPGSGEKFIWTMVTVRNEANAIRMFSYDACALDFDGQIFLPVLVSEGSYIKGPADKTESFKPGQARTRQLIYSYPAKIRPARVQCGPITFRVPDQAQRP